MITLHTSCPGCASQGGRSEGLLYTFLKYLSSEERHLLTVGGDSRKSHLCDAKVEREESSLYMAGCMSMGIAFMYVYMHCIVTQCLCIAGFAWH